MRFDRGYKYFVSNNRLVTLLWALGISLLFVCFAFALETFILWGVILCGGVCASLIIAAIIATVLLRCCVDYDGISTVVHWHRQFVAWQDINSVQILCRFDKSGIWFSIKLESDELSIKIKSYKHVITIIQEYSKNCDKFKEMFENSLAEAVKSCF